MKRIILGAMIIIGSTLTALGQPMQGDNLFEGQHAPLFQGMGVHNFDISSTDKLVNIYFNQAIALTYGFNHLEAARSYEQIVKIDPNSAISYWGQALVLGPNLNATMESASVSSAFDHIQKAKSLKNYASQKEKDLIDALAKRYSEDETLTDRTKLDQAYADAMRKVAAKYPNDPNVRTLFAEALMVIHAWDFWQGNGHPKEWTPEILEVLETGLKDYPKHTGLIHYYIHAVEASKTPGRALEYAKTMEDLVPGSGHLVHMPSHIYIRTGKYQEGVAANERAILVDNNYIAQCRQQGIYPLAYVPHNRHFLWAMATLQGNSKKAIMAAKHMANHIDENNMRIPGLGTLQHYWVTPVYAYVKFGKWDQIINTPKPMEDLVYPLGVWHYARGVAFTSKGEIEKAQQELKALNKVREDIRLQDVTVWEINNATDVLTIASLTLEGEIEAKSGNYEHAISILRKAIALEDNLNYNEPSDWHSPVRQTLGAVLLNAGRALEAEKAYKEDLETFPDNGWSLYGLYQSYKQQDKEELAVETLANFREVWKWADIELESSRVL
tara:strand:- start:38916 stop:40580 length:1665 start_codon:yes stop_codon:yes gene_type:complete